MKETVSINPNKLYTKSEYSKKIGVTRVTLDNWIKQGKVSTLKVNGAILIKD